MARTELMPPAHCLRRFRAAFGGMPYRHRTPRGIARATALLRAAMSVAEACMAIACITSESFSARFGEVLEVPADQP